jgi:DNA-directed RNA polymerase I subunit RPA49
MRSSKFINDRLISLFKQEAQDHYRLSLLFYASLLMAFYKNNKLASRRHNLKTTLGGIPDHLIDGLISRYTEGQRTSDAVDAKNR